MRSPKDPVRLLLRLMGYRVSRLRPQNRFEATGETLSLLKTAGFSPRVVVDAGANVGSWTEIVRPIFPDATFHLIEPQEACQSALRRVVRKIPRAALHAVAVTRPGVSTVRLIGGGADGGTGAWIAEPDEQSTDVKLYRATTVDELLAESISADDCTLLKLDLEGHELAALEGAVRLLENVEVLLVEARFYDIEGRGRPTFGDVVLFLRGHGFEVYDIAALYQRERDWRLRMGDIVFVHRKSALMRDWAFA